MKKILVAYNGEVLKKTIKDILKEGGYEVVTASDGIEAIATIEKERPFLVLLDVALPKIYSFELCNRIKSMDETKEILVILIASTYDATRYKREPVSLYGADDYIETHHIEVGLLDKIRNLIEKKENNSGPA